MYTKQEIILRSYREGKSQRCISRELGISRKTVKKYISAYESELGKSSDINKVITEALSSSPTYKDRLSVKHRLTLEAKSVIDELLASNEVKRKAGLRKQLLKKIDILEQLHLQGFQIGYTTVCNYIRSQEQKSVVKEAFIRQDYQPAAVCEFDWGEVKLQIQGKEERFQLAVFTSAYSNYRYAALYHRQDTLSFMDSHVVFFHHMGGVYHQMVYDNMRVAVSKFIGPHQKEPTQALLQLRGHYQFTHRFCNAYRGNEKGHVERSVEYIRRKAFGLKDQFEDLSSANKYLLSVISNINNTKQKHKGKTANELLEQEKSSLTALPTHKLICSEQVQLRVDKYSTVSYKNNRYSVPDHLVGKFLEVHLLTHQIHIYDNHKRVATHKRNYGVHQWNVLIEHYLETFKRKPGALSGSLALASNIYLKQLYKQYFQEEPRSFIELLEYCRNNSISEERIEQSVFRLLSTTSGGVTVEKLRALLGNTEKQPTQSQDSPITDLSKTYLQQIAALMN